MFSKHYQNELAFLRAAGKAYAEANPSTAGLLADRGSDPDVERLLEGFAFLAARIRERIDDAVPEVVHDLTELLLPHFLRPVPASTIVEMTPTSRSLRSRVVVPAGTEIASVPVDGTSCRFRTTADLDLLPASVTDVALDHSNSSSPRVRVQLQAAPQALPALLDAAGLRLFVHGEFPLASTVMLWFARHLRGVRVNGLATGRSVALPASAVRLVGLEPELALLPWPRLAPQGYRLLQEYFTLPQKMLFLEIRGLDRARDIVADHFELAFEFERPPELPSRLGKEAFRTNCVPAVNLFRTSGEPVSVRAFAEEHLVRAVEAPPAHMEIHTVDGVIGVPEGPGERTQYEPFVGFRHAQGGKGSRYYRLRRTLSPVDGGLDTFISVARPLDGVGGMDPQTLSLEVLATNRGLPARLKLGDVSQPTATSPTIASFRNITPVSQPVTPPLGTELHWRLMSHLAANRASIATAEELRALLGLYNLQLLSDQQSGRSNQLRVESIRGVEAILSRRLISGAPARGTRLTLTVDEAGFAGLGDAFLFGCAVDELIAAQASLSSFVELTLRAEPSLREFAWPPRNGKKALL